MSYSEIEINLICDLQTHVIVEETIPASRRELDESMPEEYHDFGLISMKSIQFIIKKICFMYLNNGEEEDEVILFYVLGYFKYSGGEEMCYLTVGQKGYYSDTKVFDLVNSIYPELFLL